MCRRARVECNERDLLFIDFYLDYWGPSEWYTNVSLDGTRIYRDMLQETSTFTLIVPSTLPEITAAVRACGKAFVVGHSELRKLSTRGSHQKMCMTCAAYNRLPKKINKQTRERILFTSIQTLQLRNPNAEFRNGRAQHLVGNRRLFRVLLTFLFIL